MENSFVEFLKIMRQEKKLTQKEMAKLLFVSDSTISKWEKNVSHPDITMLKKISEILGVSEYELISGKIDKQLRTEKVQAKKWQFFSKAWSLFFYIAYVLTLIPCFICDLATTGSLTWFFIVVSALLFSFTLTNLPKLIKKHKLILLPISTFLSLCLLLGVCCIYTKGNWFWVASISILFVSIAIFMPIYISKYKVFNKIKKYNDFICLAINFVMLNILLYTIYLFTIFNGHVNYNWYLIVALPIAIAIYLFLNLLLLVRLFKFNRFIKTSIILFLINAIYLIVPFIKVKNISVQEEINQLNIFKANFYNWKTEIPIENNINCILFLTIMALSIIFFVLGLIRHLKVKKI